mgnify:CR=1 FL=1
MPLLHLKRKANCTRCLKPLPTKVFVAEIQWNSSSALTKEPSKCKIMICLECQAKLTDRLLTGLVMSDILDVAQHYGHH